MTAEDTVDGIVARAAIADPSIQGLPARELAASCLAIANADPSIDAAELARRCVARHPEADASWVSHLARAIV